VIILGLILLIIGFVAKIAIIWTIGIIVVGGADRPALPCRRGAWRGYPRGGGGKSAAAPSTKLRATSVSRWLLFLA
jgi:hypothetical protein